MDKINTPDVLRELSKRMGAYKKDCAELLGHFAAIVAENVSAGKAVSYKDLGNFYPFKSKGRGRAEQVRLKFRPSRKVSAKVVGGNNAKEDV